MSIVETISRLSLPIPLNLNVSVHNDSAMYDGRAAGVDRKSSFDKARHAKGVHTGDSPFVNPRVSRIVLHQTRR